MGRSSKYSEAYKREAVAYMLKARRPIAACSEQSTNATAWWA